MTVSSKINGRDFSFGWDEFEKMYLNRTTLDPVVISGITYKRIPITLSKGTYSVKIATGVQ